MSILSTIGSLFDGFVETVTGVVDFFVVNPDAFAFMILAAITIVSAIFVVISEEVVHSAFYLALTFVCVAVVFFFLEAEFIGVVQLMVYVCAITIMFAFSIMLTRRTIMKERDDDE
jgi:NADH-quinone oxidoreductase subunit J